MTAPTVNVREDAKAKVPQWIVEIEGEPMRYFFSAQEAEAFVKGFQYRAEWDHSHRDDWES